MTRHMTSLKRPSELVSAGLIPNSEQRAIEDVAKRYAISIPQTIAARIDPTDPNDPLARQFVPSAHELNREPGEHDDPIGDELKSPVPGIVHRYPDRALLKLVNVCPVYCRFCFRRETVGPTQNKNDAAPQQASLSDEQLETALDYLRNTTGLWEVIITGGDPLVLSPRRIKHLNDALAQIPHIKVVRWHTRVPVIQPEHVTVELCEALKCNGKTVYIGLHTNHAKELNAPALSACARLIDAGHTMISQTVLLKGVNDDAQTLIDLMRTLIENRIKPYYLHHTDLAPGTRHFRVSIERGRQIVATMRANLSGIAQPTYVLDIPGAYGKVPIGPTYLTPTGTDAHSNTYAVRDPSGDTHEYKDRCKTLSSDGSVK